MDYRLC